MISSDLVVYATNLDLFIEHGAGGLHICERHHPLPAIIVASGYDLFDATRMPEYGYGRIRNVVTALEFERFLSASGPTHGHVYRPSDLDLKEQLPELEKQL